MNSFVSVEDEEVSCDDSLVLNASSISGSSIESENENKLNDTTETSRDSIDTDNKSTCTVSNLLVCLPASDTVGDILENQSCEPVDISLHPNVLYLEQAFASSEAEKDFRGFAVDLECLGLPILLDNEIISLDNNIGFNDTENLFLSDTESIDSFDGFTESSASSFEGFVQSNYDAYLNKDNFNLSEYSLKSSKSCKVNTEPCIPISNRPKLENDISISQDQVKLKDSKLVSTPFKRGRGRPRKTLSIPCQNSFKGLNNSFHISSSKKSQAEADGISRIGEQWQSKEKAKINLDESKPTSKCFSDPKTLGSTNYTKIDFLSISEKIISKPKFFERDESHSKLLSPDSDYSGLSEGLHRSSSEESFEGFIDIDFEVNKPAKDHNTSPNLHFNQAAEVETVSSDKKNKLSKVQDDFVKYEQDDLSDFIGYNCSAIGCTIKWLESAKIRNQPVTINNGVVHELNEFAKKINWESRYIAIWILRLRGYDIIDISDEDLKNIHLILKRRKAITINFAGSQLCKSKLNAFDKAEFSLPTAEKFDNQKNSCNILLNTSKIAESNYVDLNATLLEDGSNRLPVSFERNEKISVLSKLSVTKNKDSLVSRRSSRKRSLDPDKNDEQNHYNFKSIDQLSNDHCITKLKFDSYPEDRPSENNSRPILSSGKNEHNFSLSLRSRSRGILINEKESLDLCKKVEAKEGIALHGSYAGQCISSVKLEIPSLKTMQNYNSKLDTNSDFSEQIFDISKTRNKKFINDSYPSNPQNYHPDKDLNINKSSGHSTITSSSEFDDNSTLQKCSQKYLKSNKHISSMNMISSDDDFNRSSELKSTMLSQENLNLFQDKFIHKPFSSDNFGVSSKGRILKPTVKIQDLYNDKNLILNSSIELEPAISNNTNLVDKLSDKHYKKDCRQKGFVKNMYGIKPIQNTFSDDGNVIGKHCKESAITIKLLNSGEKSLKPITNGIIYELYHFFKKRNAKLTALVHTIYKLKGLPIEKAPIISTMAKIHELVKILWDEQVQVDPNMPFSEFEMGITSSCYSSQTKQTYEYDKDGVQLCSKKRKVEQTTLVSINERNDKKNPEDINEVASCTLGNKNENRIFDLNATKGQVGKITKGDIVYVYTRWLKKKMEGQCKVFVTDLSKDVENLIMERKVGTMRIPVGALMSSSVKLFEKFRKLSKMDMQMAKAYLLEDWIQDIQDLLKPNQSMKNTNDEDSVSLSNMSPINKDFGIDTTNIKHKSNESVAEATLHMPTSSICAVVEKSPNVVKAFQGKATKLLTVGIFGEKNLNSLENVAGLSSQLISENIQEIGNEGKLEMPAKNFVVRESIGAEEYEVEKIVGYRIVKIGNRSITEFRVRWVGFTFEEDSWVNMDDLQCPDRLTEFWEALNKQRALKNISKNSVPQVNQPSIAISVVDHQSLEHKHMSIPVANGQENVSPNARKKAEALHNIFIPMITNLKPNLIDYQYDDEGPIPKRVRVSKGEILSIFDKWCQENQEKLQTGTNIPVDVDVLISRVKEFMDIKKVRNFNPNCVFDVCFRMSLMKVKLLESNKIKEYLSGDVMDLIESSRRHQEFVRTESANKLKNHKIQVGREYQDDIEKKIKSINKIEKESLLIANYIEEHGMKVNFEEILEEDISCLKKFLSIASANHEVINSAKTMESLKNKSESTIQELKNCGLKESTIDELIKIILKST